MFLSTQLRSQVIEHRLGTQIVTLLQRLLQHRTDGTLHHRQGSQRKRIGRSPSLNSCSFSIRRMRNTDASLTQALYQSMQEKILRRLHIQGLGFRTVHMTRHLDHISPVQPIARNLQFPSLRPMTHGPVAHLVIIRCRTADHQRQGVRLRRMYGYLHTAPVQHQRRQIRLKSMRSIVPTPASPPIQGVHQRHIRYQGIGHITDASVRYRCHQAIQILLHEFRIETTHQIKVPSQGIPYHGSGISQSRIKRILRSQASQSRHRCQHLLYGSRTIQFLVLIPVNRLPRRKVPHRDAYFRGFQPRFL
ncbi:hypothetical protein EVA_06305 [gut metagenome]|uniref:Uncharacterized protein n=1 Tax=gut metagenome TaxID=749906 RepID=J9CZ92_9ZZZZ